VDFSIDALLYPLTKGDLKGHVFHGNQYELGQGGGRPPTGKLQFTNAELETFAKIYNSNPDKYEATNEVTVEMSKKLGMDKPAKEFDKAPSSDLYKTQTELWRGCDKAGVESLTQPLKSYTGGGEALYGAGVYFTPYEGVVAPYANTG
jgi:hypothetical protein